MNLRPLTDDEARKAYNAADYLLALPVRLDSELAIKLDTFRADMTAELEDRPADLGVRQAAKTVGD